MAVGFRVVRERVRADAAIIEAFAGIPVANISDTMHRVFAAGPDIRPLDPAMRVAGVALTVRTRPGDNLMLHKAVDIAEPGDVIVVEAGGDTTNALIGEIIVRLSHKRRVAGWVIDGAVRDFDALSKGMPVFARGVTHRGPYKDGPGEINVPISLAGMPVAPGDIVVGDGDGVLAIPVDQAPDILAKAEAHNAQEEKLLRQIEDGTVDRSWVDEALKTRGCVLE